MKWDFQRCEQGLSLRRARIENGAFRRNLRPIQTGKSFQEEILRLRFAFSPSGRRKLTAKNPSFSLPEFRQRRVLQVKSALQQRIPIPYGRFFQRNLRDAAAVSRPPHPGIVEAVPIPFRIGGLESRNFKIRGQQSGAAAPIARNCILVIQRKNFPVSLFRPAKSKPVQAADVLFQYHQLQAGFQPAGEMQGQTVQSAASEDQQFDARQIRIGFYGAESDFPAFQQRGGAAVRIE